MTETAMHDAFMAWLDKRGVPYRHDRTDKKTVTTPGEPDFIVIWMSHAIYIEVKKPKGVLSDVQKTRIKYLRAAGNRVEICRSVPACIDAAESILCESIKPLPAVPTLRTEQTHAGEAPAHGNGRFIGELAGQPWVFERVPNTRDGVRAIGPAPLNEITTLPRA